MKTLEITKHENGTYTVRDNQGVVAFCKTIKEAYLIERIYRKLAK